MERTSKPNIFQRALHRFLMVRPMTAVLIHILHRADTLTWKWNGGAFSLTSALAGLPTFKVTTIGAKSKLPRSVPLVGLPDGEKIALVASNFGQSHHPAWYHNLKANPECQLEINGIDKLYLARQAEGAERHMYWNMAVSYYAGYAVYARSASPRRIPIMVLEPRKQLRDS
jgi:deazaflavin-dependent oxidoreductase (nitroreductase family)